MDVGKYPIYLARLLSACCFYLFLAKANIWLDKTDNTIMVFGYRGFILLAPLFLLITTRWIAFFAFLTSTTGIALWFGDKFLLGTILFSAGMAVGGYVLKYYAASTPGSAANNRIAMNIGGVLSGMAISLPMNDQYFLWLGFGMLVATILCSLFPQEESDKRAGKEQKLNFSFSQLNTLRGTAWAVVGAGIGIKLVGLTSVLPQYLINYYGYLPSWYGWTISLNCIAVVFLQKPIMHFMQQLNLNQAITALLLSMVVIAFPSLFFCQYLLGAMIWIFILTVFECAVSYLDVFSREEGTLLIKEFSVGVGMALTVFLMRSFIPTSAALLIGALGFLGVLIAMKILRSDVRTYEEVTDV